jgi:septal ring factor EnvC (AmiA/AmiB activator)
MQIKTILPLVYLLITAAILPAQQNVTETEKVMSFGSRPCFRIDFPGATTAILEEEWKDWALKNHSAKLKKKGGELYATELKSKQTGEEYAVYSTIEKTSGGAALNVWFDLGASFLNSRDNPSQAEDAKKALQQFYYDIRHVTYDEDIKKEEQKLKLLEDENATMEKNALALQKSIDEYKAKIKKAEDSIAQLSKNQEASLLNIENQRKRIEEMKKRKMNVGSEGH